ncbi:methyltransferase domain-containing protein [Aeromonas sp. 2HA2]|uniref:class I SAM-dependent methyltransferase n=1 Tax=Aeromonas TaxID=642 RepID=UPI0023DDA578|nr:MULTISPECIES: class I SAM-dependent methyltransferase [Aeromonas]MDF2391395.1 methyltransferase domain-containing protein [Aeromonas sp. 2MA4]MDF2409788.1 methyltransferase domain-containing protein [Aeromonas sp. 2HA2]MDM5062881.1 class I SAM-dependent methyltransferase [Aeromonas salmonicida]
MSYSLYQEIYNNVFLSNSDYLKAEFSPGYRIVIEHSDIIRVAGEKHLDYGCGVGFVVGLLGSKLFGKDSYGVDVSKVALDIAKERGIESKKLFLLQDHKIPFPDNFFDLITCCDVVEHLELDDILNLSSELNRVLSPNGVLLLNISTRLAGSKDLHGDNLHRTVKDPNFYSLLFNLDRYIVNNVEKEITAIRHGKWID